MGWRQIGAEKRHRLMLATLESFGPNRPAADRETRTSQLAKIVRKKENPYNDQDREWYKTVDEHLDRLILRYNLANLKGRNKAELNYIPGFFGLTGRPIVPIGSNATKNNPIQERFRTLRSQPLTDAFFIEVSRLTPHCPAMRIHLGRVICS